ncbi:hypothetical protein [Kitasatospora sp. NPDC047058]|uniref:hypothetical protein n=1 Tax=Kitasatospora sp. NPDC047058 TaxID=3155620 RepID=UPI0033CD057D
MSSTTPAPERAPRGTGAGEPARSVQGAPMRALLAACAAAEAVSTPPERGGNAELPGTPGEPTADTPRAA